MVDSRTELEWLRARGAHEACGQPMMIHEWSARYSSPIFLGGGFKYLFKNPYLGKIPILTSIFQMGWNHQPVLARLGRRKENTQKIPFPLICLHIDLWNFKLLDRFVGNLGFMFSREFLPSEKGLMWIVHCDLCQVIEWLGVMGWLRRPEASDDEKNLSCS